MRKLIALIALAAAAACGSDTSTPSEPLVESLAGVYTLQTMNGSALPYTIAVSSTTTVIIDSDVLTMTDAGVWSETVLYREVESGTSTNATDEYEGTWTRTGNALRFSSEGTLFYLGSAAPTTLSLSDGGYTYVFTR